MPREQAKRRMSPLRMATFVLLAVVAAAGYWWFNLPPGPYKPDNGGLYPIKVDGKYGYMDRSGKTVIAPQFDDVGPFSEGLAPVRIGDKLGYIDPKGTIVITPQFAVGGAPLSASGFHYGRAMVMLGGRYGFIDTSGKYIHTPEYSWANPFFGNFAPVRSDSGYAFLDRSGTVVLADRFERLLFGFSEGLAPAFQGGKWGFIDTTGSWVVDPQFEDAGSFGDGLAPVKVGGRTGYIDRKGKFVINPQYDSGLEFTEAHAAVNDGGGFTFIDTKGSVVGTAKYLSAGFFADGLAAVQTEGGFGFIDPTGKMVIAPQFDSADMFQNGLAHVTALGKEGYIDTKGVFVVDPFPGTTVRAEKERIAAEARAADVRRATEAAQAAENSLQASAAIRSRLEWMLEKGRVWTGDSWNSRERWPMSVRIVTFEGPTGKFIGEVEWKTLAAVHRIEGSLVGERVVFTETAYIRKGNAALGVTYELSLQGADRLVGVYRGSGDSGQTQLVVR